MKFSKKILIILLVLSTISLCLAKPRWIWEDEEENGGVNDEDMKRETRKNERNMGTVRWGQYLGDCPPGRANCPYSK